MIAYFSMEIGIDPRIPTYAGGPGVLAGDTVRAAADLGLPSVAVTLLHRHGYVHQRLDAAGRQREEPAAWSVERVLEPLLARATVSINNRPVIVRAWQRTVVGVSGASVPVIFLDTDLEENAPDDRILSHDLYGGDAVYRLAQEAVLGIGGVRLLRALGYSDIQRFHLNEGHSALLTSELVAERLRSARRATVTDDDCDAVRRLCVFTTHTPVSAALDRFPPALVEKVLGPTPLSQLWHQCCYEGALNMTHLALHFSHFINGVAMRHGEVSRRMFAGYEIDAITNGVHAATWVSPPFAELFDRLIVGWRRDNFSLRYAVSIPRRDIWAAHVAAKQRLIDLVNHAQSTLFDPSVLTLGFARRATAYKRADLIVSDLDRLRSVAALAGRLQLVFGGKAHPRDEEGKRVIERVCRARDALGDRIPIAYLEDYDMAQAAVLTAGSDVWLNTPLPPLEASGTSGMKAALNGVPSLSVLDGWWLEGHVEGITGWAIGVDGRHSSQPGPDSAEDAVALYNTLERAVLPTFYQRREAFIDMMRYTIALNGGFFTAQRMLQEYLAMAYDLRSHLGQPRVAPRGHGGGTGDGRSRTMTAIRRILCPVDFSDHSKRALDHALAIAAWYDSTVTVLHVSPVMPVAAYVSGSGMPAYATMTSDMRDARKQSLCRFAGHHPGAAARQEFEIAEGGTADTILARASALPADLLVLGTHGRSGFERWVLGSVAERVLRLAPCPVLTVPRAAGESAPILFRRIVCAIDFSDCSMYALDYATSLAQQANAQLTVVHVIELPPDIPREVHETVRAGPRSLSEYIALAEEVGRGRLDDAVADRVRAAVSVDKVLAAGKPYREILRVAAEHCAELLVLGVHGRSALDRMFFGSTTQHLVRQASCPVLTLRKDWTD